MPYKFFAVPVHASQTIEDELNASLRGHRVLAVDRRFVDQGSSSFCWFRVEYLDAETAPLSNLGRGGSRGEIDYRQVLSPDDFAIYAKLRELRKELAQADGVPPYQVFNNRQLAEMVQKRMRTIAALRSLPGVGDARAAKYGSGFLKILNEIGERSIEADGKPV